MKTEVRKEHGDWIVFVDDNPQFSFMYREEAEKVRNMVDALIEAHKFCTDMEEIGMSTPRDDEPETIGLLGQIEQALKDIGAI